MRQPKWFVSDRDTKVGDVVSFLKSDKEFDKQYQYGIVKDITIDKDGKIRKLKWNSVTTMRIPAEPQ